MSDRPKWSKESKENNKSKKISETRLERKKIYQVNIPENRYVDRLEKKKRKRENRGKTETAFAKKKWETMRIPLQIA